MSEQLSEAGFVEKVEQAIAVLEQSFADLADDREIDVGVEGGVLTVTFEEGEPGRFIVSPNSSVRQIWVSARVSSFKFNWSEEAGQFLLAGTGEPLKEVMTRLTREQLGDSSVSL
ncbi:MAG TPA: iron donor protein CyaY [Blastocatellia bacterium]|jgi:CyaY protein|nr:iron donor protein CyaY [Blastocatellia bacterium]